MILIPATVPIIFRQLVWRRGGGAWFPLAFGVAAVLMLAPGAAPWRVCCEAGEPGAGTQQEPRAAAPPLEFQEVPAAGTVPFLTTPAESTVPAHFQLARHEFPCTAAFVRRHAAVEIHRITFPSAVSTEIAENNTVHAKYFQPAGKGPHPGVVVLHILGGDFLLSETIANHLAQHGIAALFVKMPYYGERRSAKSPRRMISRVPQESVEGMTQGVLDIRRATAWLGVRPEVDPGRLGITGISLGGIMSALGAAAEPRLQNVALYLAGGNFGQLVWGLEHTDAELFRQKWLAAGGTQASFSELVSRIDPVTYGHLLKGRRVLMVAASHDEVIPPDSARSLWESIGREPQIFWLDAGHYTAARYLPFELIRLDLFFNKSPQPAP